MTIDEVDSMVTSNNLQLKASLLEVDAAHAQLQQARKYDNPELQLMHNLQNPVNRKWLDTGHHGRRRADGFCCRPSCKAATGKA